MVGKSLVVVAAAIRLVAISTLLAFVAPITVTLAAVMTPVAACKAAMGTVLTVSAPITVVSTARAAEVFTIAALTVFTNRAFVAPITVTLAASTAIAVFGGDAKL
jgi:hypothetical protein